MSEKTYQINRDTVPNRAKDYYENNKRLREQARVKHRNLYLEDKNKREYNGNKYHNMSEERKQKLNKYQKKLS